MKIKLTSLIILEYSQIKWSSKLTIWNTQYTSNTLQDMFFATLLSVFGDYTV